jgi:hypothetical protein
VGTFNEQVWGLSDERHHYVLVVCQTDGCQETILPDHVPVEAWPPEALSEKYFEGTLNDDADELVMGEVIELLRKRDIEWPLCPTHPKALMACSGVWVCGSWVPGATHDLGRVGTLTAAYGDSA